MKLVTLDSVLTFHRGITFKPDDKVEVGSSESVVCLRTKNIQKELDESDLLAVPSSFVKRDELYVNQGDILISTANSWELVGKCVRVVKTQYKSTIGGFISLLRPKSELIDPDYLFRFLSMDETQERIRHLGKKTTNISNLDRVRFLQLQIPLPPLETQKKIAAVLEKADQLRKDCKLLEQELNSLAQSVFIDMFGDPVTNPKGWDKVPLSKIADDFLGGKSLVAAEDQSTFYKNRVLKISAVTSGEFKPQESKPLPNDYEPQDEHFVKAGDLLFSRANTTELVGATAMVFDEHTGLVLPDKLWRFVWKDEKSLSPVFIWQQLCEAGVRKEISKLSSGSGGSMKNISKGKLNTLQIVFPPLALQQKFERIYLKLRVELSNNQQQIKFADQAFNALMQKAFKGELTL
ncbi:restriction endonuclease subunit S [Vibrio cholerae]|uniref:restriction endonuclease subunit S n=1 Tax=Vibrio TaxID=662 RepID=UPI000E65391B|nr:restriction endonuclease subunit S [Vibrio cholerae]EGR0603895.1 restriction endonuclease subunit S [Vibrio cholerae]EGR2510308.1 restriction endonuclease subunit S [Vibrio cholerae]EGR4445258.1 restriction endonuclease subunit S [Vibrio cholerae]EIN5953616.1 restriction endonuclease subunit S [Vibrio cholerae]EIV0334895.1 restriction endonuclease subunit S [Vibrio cholerae]